jgi:hypothetical protein
LFHKIAATSAQNGSIWFQLCPDLKRSVALDESKCWIKLQVWLKVFGEGKLYLHAVWRPIVQDDFFTIKLFVDEYVEVVFFFFNIDWDIHTAPPNRDRDRLCVVLVFKKERKPLLNPVQFVRHKCKLNLSA